MSEERIDAVFDSALRRLGVRRAVREAQVGLIFDEVVGAALAGRCRAVSLQRGVLCIAVSHPALSHQLQLDTPRLIAAINERLGAETVRRLRFTTLSGR